ncbi:Uncharacterised protein (plasmid) [Tsukamurella tyrosinosolvens]|uniref:Uncharacterized protein n=1 Tax=Tsukamurella tyrosinosolvens TaxID=57704 RepID=A0A1H4VQS5_TSUTY|nr:hypothetical protein [Tsukamurella tyrosinosolvens]SEC83396.1 hypothetical protein SAMN04489793_3307 [Tsukamurella tyrosinosolvens]VEH90358.1 Uncharacterised protein [Tsukamurella tyrosinosolvens]
MHGHDDEILAALVSDWDVAPPRSESGQLFCPHEVQSVVADAIRGAWAVLAWGPVLLAGGEHGDELTYRVWHAGSEDVPPWVLEHLLPDGEAPD